MRRCWAGSILERRWALLCGIMFLGLAARVFVSLTAYASTFDTATVGLMGLRILQGEHYLFFEGQNYMGSLEAYLAALLFAAFGPGEFTLSLSPILFSLGWIAATFLLFQELLGMAAAVGAALTLSIPTWVTLWYCVGSYGGYPGSFFFGTMALWLAVRVASRNSQGRALWFSAFFIGLLSGLAVWTDFLAIAYVGLAGLIIAGWLAKNRFHANLVAPFAGTILGAFVGGAPLLLNWRKVLDERAVGWIVSPSVILAHFLSLMARPMRDNLVWHFRGHPVLGYATLALLGAAVVLCVVAFASSQPNMRMRFSLPIAFCVLFLVLYLPHPLASAKAPRHVLPLWTMVVAGAFSIPLAVQRDSFRRSAWMLLCAWLAIVSGQDALAALEKHPRRAACMQTRTSVAKAAEHLGLRNVEMIGGHIFGHEGQIFTFAAKGAANFVNVFEERHQASAQASEGDASVAFGCQKRHLPIILKTLEDIGANWMVEEAGSLSLVHSVVIKPLRRSSIPVASLSARLLGGATGEPTAVFDRKTGTVVSGKFGESEGLIVDVGEERLVNSLYLVGQSMSEKGLPEDVRVDVCCGDSDWQTVRQAGRRVPNAHVSGNRIYMEGYNPATEIRFAAVKASKVRLIFLAGGSKQETWSVDEICIFEDRGGGAEVVDEAEVSSIAKEFIERGCSFAVCDRWLSAALLDRIPWSGGRPPVFPRFNPKHRETLLPRRFMPSAGMAFVLPLDLASDAEEVLRRVYGTALRWERIDHEHYAFIAVTGADSAASKWPRLRWDGVLLREAEQERGG